MIEADQNNLADAGWESRSYKIATIDGPKEVTGLARKHLAVREQCLFTPEEGYSFWWIVEHVPSGRKIAHFFSKWVAFHYVDDVLDHPQWADVVVKTDLSKTPAIPKDLMLHLKKFREYYNNKDQDWR